MALLFDPRQQLDISVPANAMNSQLDRGSGLVKETWGNQQKEKDRELDYKRLKEEIALRKRQLDQVDRQLDLAEESGDESLWETIIGTGISIIPGIGGIASNLFNKAKSASITSNRIGTSGYR